MTLNRRHLTHFLLASLSTLALVVAPAARAADDGPDDMIRRLSTDVLNNIKADKDVQKGDVTKITTFVDTKVMPNVNFPLLPWAATGVRQHPSSKSDCRMNSKACWFGLTLAR